MFAEKAFELVKELERCPENLPPFNDDGVRQVLAEITVAFEENHLAAIQCSNDASRTLIPLLTYRHSLLQRNKRCLLAYLYNRLLRIKDMRWEFGPAIPADIKANLCEPEIQWFNSYSRILSNYMRSIGDGHGVSLTEDMRPPKSLFVEVRCLVDYGKFELEDGEVILLKKNSQHYLPRIQCEPLIRQGILQHIV